MTHRKKIIVHLFSGETDSKCADVCKKSAVLPELLRRWLITGFILWDKQEVRGASSDVSHQFNLTYSHYKRDGCDEKLDSTLLYLEAISNRQYRMLVVRHLVLLGFEFEERGYEPQAIPQAINNVSHIPSIKNEATVVSMPVVAKDDKDSNLSSAQGEMKGLMG